MSTALLDATNCWCNYVKAILNMCTNAFTSTYVVTPVVLKAGSKYLETALNDNLAAAQFDIQ